MIKGRRRLGVAHFLDAGGDDQRPHLVEVVDAAGAAPIEKLRHGPAVRGRSPGRLNACPTRLANY